MLQHPSHCVVSNASAGRALSNAPIGRMHDVADCAITAAAAAITSPTSRAGRDEGSLDDTIAMSRDREMPIA
jgi:hypothetical protein